MHISLFWMEYVVKKKFHSCQKRDPVLSHSNISLTLAVTRDIFSENGEIVLFFLLLLLCTELEILEYSLRTNQALAF